MPDIHIRTFLRDACYDSAKVVHKYERRAKSNGGGNYYQSSLLGITDIALDGAAYDQAAARFANIKQNGERIHNARMLLNFYGWWSDHRGSTAKPPHAHMIGPKGKLRVRVHPDMLVKRGKQREITLIWNYNVAIPKRIAGVGVYVMQKYLGPLGYADCNFVVHDLFAERRHCLGAIPDKAASVLSIELARQEEAAIAAREPSKGKGSGP